MKGNKLDKQLLTSTGNNELSMRGCCRTCSRLFPSSTSPCWLGSGSARCKVPSRLVISPKEPSCRFDWIVELRSSMKRKERKNTEIVLKGEIIFYFFFKYKNNVWEENEEERNEYVKMSMLK